MSMDECMPHRIKRDVSQSVSWRDKELGNEPRAKQHDEHLGSATDWRVEMPLD